MPEADAPTTVEPEAVTNRFPQGVASFDPLADRVLIWARCPSASRVDWVMAEGTGGATTDPKTVAEGTAEVDHDRDHTVVVDVTGLEPGAAYTYWFTVDGDRSPVGRTRTLPEAGTDEVTLAFTVCADYARGAPLGYAEIAADEDLDLVVHLGDYIYEGWDPDAPRRVEPAHDCVTLDDYRARYRQARREHPLAELHRRQPMAAVWDDHDIVDNAWRNGAKIHDPDRQGPWEDRLAAAARARQEYVPARLRTPPGASEPDEKLLWRSFPIGDLAELVLLDARLAGRDEPADASSQTELSDPNRSILGTEQLRWASGRITDTTRPWSIVISSVPMSPLVLGVPRFVDAEAMLPEGYSLTEGRMLCTDQWDGYPAERERVAAAMRERAGGCIVASGDIHSSWAMDGPDTEGPPAANEIVVPAVSHLAMGIHLPKGGRPLLGQIGREMDHVRWVNITRRGYVTLTVGPRRATARWHLMPHEYTSEGEAAGERSELGAELSVTPEPGARWELHHTPRSVPAKTGRRRTRLAGAAALAGAAGGAVATRTRRAGSSQRGRGRPGSRRGGRRRGGRRRGVRRGQARGRGPRWGRVLGRPGHRARWRRGPQS